MMRLGVMLLCIQHPLCICISESTTAPEVEAINATRTLPVLSQDDHPIPWLVKTDLAMEAPDKHGR